MARSRTALVTAALFAVLSFAFLLAPRAASAAEPAYLINTVLTSQWTPPSPDPSGITYLPSSGHLLIVDGEVDELPAQFQGFNMFELTTSGQLVRATTTIEYTGEPTGVTFAADRTDVFVSDDDADRIYQVDPGLDEIFGNTDDSVAWFSTSAFGCQDAEGVAYGNGKLFVASGTDAEIFVVSPGVNGLFDGVAPTGDDTVTQFDTAALGITDPEGIAFSASSGSLYIVGSGNKLVETTQAGVLLRVIQPFAAPIVSASGIVIAPGSQNTGAAHLYVTDRGVDNAQFPGENDGRIFELTMDRSELPADLELLGNPGFESDDDLDGRPDLWIPVPSPQFVVSSQVVHGGARSGLLQADRAILLSAGQYVNFLTPGETYSFSGWVNIPPSDGSGELVLAIRWHDSAGVALSTTTVKTYSAPTDGWDNAAADVVAPAGAVTALVRLRATAGSWPIFVDDFSLKVAGAPPSTTSTTEPPSTTTTVPPTTTTVPPTTTTVPPTTTTTEPATTTTTVAPTTTTTVVSPTVTRDVVAGWNLLAGGPGSDCLGRTLYSFNGSAYQATTEDGMEVGRGYWVRFNEPATVSLVVVSAPLTVHVVPGWNLIGNTTASQLSLPAGKTAYVFNGSSYLARTSLEPGQGAWLKALVEEDLVLAAAEGSGE